MDKVEFKPGKLYITTESGKKLEFYGVAKFETSPSVVAGDDYDRGSVIMISHLSKTDKSRPIKY